MTNRKQQPPKKSNHDIDDVAAARMPRVGATLPRYKSVASQTKNPNKKKSKLFSLKRVLLLILILLIAAGVFLAGDIAYNLGRIFQGGIFSFFDSSKLNGEASGRINILLAGNSADDPGHQGANLTDSIMIVSIDNKNNTAFLLSIPRDLWVYIPANGYQKINDAYVVGSNNSSKTNSAVAGGMDALEGVISRDLGIKTDYYALINYQALKGAVNAVGGITVNIQSSDPRGLYDPSIDYSTGGPLADYTNGYHTLNGQQALDLARARGDAPGSYGFANSDFERTKNQRLMLIALKQKATSIGVLSNPIRVTQLIGSLGSNVKTDLTIGQARTLLNIANPIKSKDIRSLSLHSLLTNYNAPDGEEALIPKAGFNNYSQIEKFISSYIK